MEERMIQNFNMYFPVYTDPVLSYRAISSTDLIVTYASGYIVLYDDVKHTTTVLTKNDEPISESTYRREMGRRLTKMLLFKHVTQKELAEALNVSQGTISNYITGKSLPSPYMLHRIARVLKCSTDELIVSI